MTVIDWTKQDMSLESALDVARRRIEVEDDELVEARKRRGLLADSLRRAFPGSRVYVNGSVAHGDALTPLTDIDLGVVVPDPMCEYGPGKAGPSTLKTLAAEAIRGDLKEMYPRLRVEVEGRKRSVLVRFGDPVTPGQADFTADVIVAIDNPSGEGLYIPSYDVWDRSHPERHIELVLEAIHRSRVSYARVVRLLKHWARRHNKPLCSWHIKALALPVFCEPLGLLEGIDAWFSYAISELEIRETSDPAGVAAVPILSPVGLSHAQLANKLGDAHRRLRKAIQLEKAGWSILALDELAKFFNDEDMLPRPDQLAVTRQEAQRRATTRSAATVVSSPRAWTP